MSRDWCFTAWTLPVFDKDNCKYVVFGNETCPSTGKLHYQGFAVFVRTCRIPMAKKWIGAGDGCNVEPRRGTRKQAADY